MTHTHASSPQSTSATSPDACSRDVDAAMALPRLDATRYVSTLVGSSLVVAGMIAATLFVAGQPTWWRGFTAGGIAAAASLLVSLAIVLPMFRRSVSTLMYSFLVAGVIRTAILGLIVVVAIKSGGYPERPTLVIAGLLYVTITTVEALIVWSMTGGRGNTAIRSDGTAVSSSSFQPMRDRA